MNRTSFLFLSSFLITSALWAKGAKLAEKLLSSDPATRTSAVEEFNKMPAEAQAKLVPDFMVALNDENPQKRKIAARILKAMGVKAEAQIPDVKTTPESTRKAVVDPAHQEQFEQLQHEKAQPGYAELEEKLRNERPQNGYDGLRGEMEAEKKGQVLLNAKELKEEFSGSSVSPSVVQDSLKDPDPWVRAQAARRLANVQPAPVETIPTLTDMLSDPNAKVRAAAVAALGSFGPLAHEALPKIKQALADGDADVRQLAADALHQIQP